MQNYIFKNTKALSVGYGPCIKQEVRAMLKLANGKEFFGTNEMKSYPGKTCPRDDLGMVSGEGYDLCKSKCSQDFHAEHEAVERALEAKEETKGSVMYLMGHTYCCNNCMTQMRNAGVAKVIYVNENNREEIL